MNHGDPVHPADEQPARRSFLVRLWAVAAGGIVGLFPFAAGWGVFSDPLRRGQAAAADGGDSSTEKFVRICPLDALPADGVPRPFPVIDDAVDAWTRATDQRIGMVFLSHTTAADVPKVAAFNAECPHLGCFVDFNPSDGHFECPCHESAFDKTGKQLFGPSRRDLDPLAVKLDTSDGQTVVCVAFQKFQSGIAERKPAE